MQSSCKRPDIQNDAALLGIDENTAGGELQTHVLHGCLAVTFSLPPTGPVTSSAQQVSLATGQAASQRAACRARSKQDLRDEEIFNSSQDIRVRSNRAAGPEGPTRNIEILVWPVTSEKPVGIDSESRAAGGFRLRRKSQLDQHDVKIKSKQQTKWYKIPQVIVDYGELRSEL